MLTIGTVYRNAKENQDPTVEVVDGLPNFKYVTYVPGRDRGFSMERRIHSSAMVTDPEGNKRCPVIIISSSPHKAGSADTPWRDTYAPDHGYVKYYGDNKTVGEDPNSKQNRRLVELLPVYNSSKTEERLFHAVPVVFFERVAVDGRPKGNLKFHGYGVLEGAKLVTQYDAKKEQFFSNYMFDFCVFSLKEDKELFDWNWIAKRCDPTLTAKQTERYAPAAWKKWMKNGSDCLHLCRRPVP